MTDWHKETKGKISIDNVKCKRFCKLLKNIQNIGKYYTVLMLKSASRMHRKTQDEEKVNRRWRKEKIDEEKENEVKEETDTREELKTCNISCTGVIGRYVGMLSLRGHVRPLYA